MQDVENTNRQPGSPGLWTFVFIDMMVFFMFFAVYVTERHRLPEVFLSAQHMLNPLVGLLSTVVLLSSSWCMAEAVRAARLQRRRHLGWWLNGALLLGLVFVLNKLVEYGDKADAGLTPLTNSFFTFYFLITGIHFLHVIAGMIFIGHCRTRVSTEGEDPAFVTKLESVGLFWHFVDILWLFIFPMIYLTELVGP